MVCSLKWFHLKFSLLSILVRQIYSLLHLDSTHRLLKQSMATHLSVVTTWIKLVIGMSLWPLGHSAGWSGNHCVHYDSADGAAPPSQRPCGCSSIVCSLWHLTHLGHHITLRRGNLIFPSNRYKAKNARFAPARLSWALQRRHIQQVIQCGF